MKIKCDKCHKELKEMGALIFSPPETSYGGYPKCDKIHLCVDCYWRLMGEFLDKN